MATLQYPGICDVVAWPQIHIALQVGICHKIFAWVEEACEAGAPSVGCYMHSSGRIALTRPLHTILTQA